MQHIVTCGAGDFFGKWTWTMDGKKWFTIYRRSLTAGSNDYTYQFKCRTMKQAVTRLFNDHCLGESGYQLVQSGKSVCILSPI